MDRWLARVCSLCPLCASARMWPKSRLHRLVALYGRFCPFCRARRRLADERGGEETGSKLADGVVLLLWPLGLAAAFLLALRALS